MYSDIFESSVTLSNIAFCFKMYPNICISLIENMVDFKNFEDDMIQMSLPSISYDDCDGCCGGCDNFYDCHDII